MHLVEDDRAGTHTIAPLGVIGAAFYFAQILAPLQNLFCVIVKPRKLGFPFWVFQRFHDILHRGDGLLLVVGADIHVVVRHRVVWADERRRGNSNHAILASAAPDHSKQRLEPGASISAIGAQPKPQRKGLPRKKAVIRKIPGDTEVFPHTLGIHINIFSCKNAPDQCNKGVLLLASTRSIVLHLLNVLQDLRGNITAHRPRWALLP